MTPASLLLLLLAADVRVAILPLECKSSDAAEASQVAELLVRVVSQLRGLQLVEAARLPEPASKRYRQLRERCGGQLDCQLKLGRQLKAQVLLVTQVSGLPGGRLLELMVLDLGSGRVKRRVSRTLAGPEPRQLHALEAILTESFFPERMVGRIELRLDPPGGRVLLDGRLRVKNAPALVNLENVPEGRHTVEVELAGHADFIAFVHVPFLGVSQLDVRLRKAE